MDWLKTNWFLVVAVVSVSAAWGQQQQKITTLEQAIIQQSAQAKHVDEIRIQSGRQDEKLKNIERSQENTEKLLQAILTSNRAIERKVAK